MTQRRATLKDIADKTGFSINTVSVALRGGKKIPEKTSAIILEAARALNYLPNALARSLARNSSRTIGLIISNLQNPILTLSARHIESEMEPHGFQTVLRATNGSPEQEKRALDSLREHQVEGILIYPTHHLNIDHLIALRRANFPIVLLAGAPNPQIDLVAVDDYASSLKLTSHLLGLGHRRIGLLDIGRAHGNFRKLGGYIAAHEAFGAEFDPRLVYCPVDSNSADSGFRRSQRLIKVAPKPTAVIGTSDLLAIGIMSWCRINGLNVPDDLSVAGFDDIESSAHLAVPLTTMRYSAKEIAVQAVARLVALMNAGDKLPEPKTTLIQPDLMIRSSTTTPHEATERGVPAGQYLNSNSQSS
ncbi:MAG: LacI family DNA-binding transcriptional regulator [Cypionkella sp.]